MVIDTSAIIAILFAEAEATRMVQAINGDPTRVIGGPTMVEAAAVMLGRTGSGGLIALDALFHRLRITVEPFPASAADYSRSAYTKFGKGVGSPPVLNYGDCLSYGMAKALGEPLLFTGEDFHRTDVDAVAY